MRRHGQNKASSRRQFNRRAGKTDRRNLSSPMRGGWRL